MADITLRPEAKVTLSRLVELIYMTEPQTVAPTCPDIERVEKLVLPWRHPSHGLEYVLADQVAEPSEGIVGEGLNKI